ncbi:putative catalytic [Hibiscus syriacus]|uniref:Catalytic n=1 Tax=Hibiscus syriacus TaxID=106335 RepID=A0A6A3AZA1_HIBSY|nr:putative catalytic [Hibiscus syriacus]
MKREEKSEEGLAEKEENLCEKFGRRVLLVGNRKTEGPCTPFPSWKLYDPQSHLHHNNSLLPPPAAVSARKLAASLWEFHQYLSHRPHNFKMHRGGVNNTNGRYTQRLHHNKNKAIDYSHFLADPCPSSDPDQPESSSSLRRHIAQTLMKHHRSIEKSNQALQPVSPASYGSSMEVAPYNPAVTPSSSVSFRGRIGELHYNLKTSTELLKVLNHIWSLEEQHASNISLIKALKKELDHARVRIKDLLRDQQACRLEIDDLMKQIAEDKLARKSKEQDRVHAAVQSARDELEDERKLRKRSENLHRKLAREVSESKASLSNALKDLERERKSRKLLEDLCDEFARGIKNYELDLHTLRQKSDEDWTGVADHDRSILHISESWLDERMQMKLEEAQSGFPELNSIVDKLAFEIETFLQVKQISTSVCKRTDYLSQKDRRKSLESIPSNEAASVGKDVCHEEDSVSSDSNCFELNKPSSVDLKSHEDEALNRDGEEIMKSNHAERKLSSHEKIKSRHPSSLQVRFEEKMARAMSNENKMSQLADAEEENIVGNATEATISQKLENDEATQYGNEGRNNKLDEIHGLSSNT